MNTTGPGVLPELGEERIDGIERRLFAEIGSERQRRRTRRRTGWLVTGAAAAVVVAAAAIAPAVGGLVGPSLGEQSAVAPPSEGGTAVQDGQGVAREEAGAAASDAAGSDMALDTPAGRDIVTSASVTLTVDDVPDAADEVAAAAEAAGGYVQSQSVGSTGAPVPIEPGMGGSDISYPAPSPTDGAWITVRVPAAELTAFVDGLGELGEVTQASIDRQDVTDQTVDLRARVEATQASVDRLTELLAQAGDLSDLIAAESALAERQATLESYQQQLESLEGQIELSSVSVSLSPRVERVTADPAGFTDGVVAGWNGLIATLNGVVIALGFLLPWLGVLGVVALIVWGIVRLRRARRRRAPAPAPAERE